MPATRLHARSLAITSNNNSNICANKALGSEYFLLLATHNFPLHLMAAFACPAPLLPPLLTDWHKLFLCLLLSLACHVCLFQFDGAANNNSCQRTLTQHKCVNMSTSIVIPLNTLTIDASFPVAAQFSEIMHHSVRSVYPQFARHCGVAGFVSLKFNQITFLVCYPFWRNPANNPINQSTFTFHGITFVFSVFSIQRARTLWPFQHEIYHRRSTF